MKQYLFYIFIFCTIILLLLFSSTSVNAQSCDKLVADSLVITGDSLVKKTDNTYEGLTGKAITIKAKIQDCTNLPGDKNKQDPSVRITREGDDTSTPYQYATDAEGNITSFDESTHKSNGQPIFLILTQEGGYEINITNQNLHFFSYPPDTDGKPVAKLIIKQDINQPINCYQFYDKNAVSTCRQECPQKMENREHTQIMCMACGVEFKKPSSNSYECPASCSLEEPRGTNSAICLQTSSSDATNCKPLTEIQDTTCSQENINDPQKYTSAIACPGDKLYKCDNPGQSLCVIAHTENVKCQGLPQLIASPTRPAPAPPCARFVDASGSEIPKEQAIARLSTHGESVRCAQVATGVGEIGTDPGEFIKSIFGILLSLSGGIALLLIIRAGFGLITSQGDPEKIQGAKETMVSAIVGLLFIIFSIAILQFIGVDILVIPQFGPR